MGRWIFKQFEFKESHCYILLWRGNLYFQAFKRIFENWNTPQFREVYCNVRLWGVNLSTESIRPLLKNFGKNKLAKLEIWFKMLTNLIQTKDMWLRILVLFAFFIVDRLVISLILNCRANTLSPNTNKKLQATKKQNARAPVRYLFWQLSPPPPLWLFLHRLTSCHPFSHKHSQPTWHSL